MTESAHPGRSFRQQLVRAATQLRPAEPMRILAKRAAPLVRHGERLGALQVLLRLTFGVEAPARGVLVFEWPARAHGHSIVTRLERWSGRVGAQAAHAPAVSCRQVPASDGDGAGTHLKVEFDVAGLSEEADELLELAARVGLADVLAGVEDATVSRATPRSAAPTTAGADAIAHNALFDSAAHPHVSVNDEVTNSSGATFRLVTKRVDGQPRRVWIRVARGGSRVSRAS